MEISKYAGGNIHGDRTLDGQINLPRLESVRWPLGLQRTAHMKPCLVYNKYE